MPQLTETPEIVLTVVCALHNAHTISRHQIAALRRVCFSGTVFATGLSNRSKAQEHIFSLVKDWLGQNPSRHFVCMVMLHC